MAHVAHVIYSVLCLHKHTFMLIDSTSLIVRIYTSLHFLDILLTKKIYHADPTSYFRDPAAEWMMKPHKLLAQLNA